MATLPSTVCPSLHLLDNGKSKEILRRSGGYHPSVWGDQFINNYSHDQKKIDAWTKRAEELKKEVKEILKNRKDSLQTMNLIDTLQCLGLAHNYENEIEESLCKLYDGKDVNSDNLHMVALRFRLLRQQGYNVSSDVFQKFHDGEGNFKESLTSDVEGLLSLYEATHLSVHGEDILDDALKFTRTHLKSMMGSLSSPLSKKVQYALELPLYKCFQRLNARRYISVYEEDKARNDVILEFAKLDFNLLQSLYQREIRDLSMWRREMDLPSKLPFARDRMVECYFWILGVYYEEKYSRCRMIVSKIINLTSYMDDIYDLYGTIDELQLLTDAIQRWEVAATEQLPEWMKAYFLILLKTFDQIDDQLAQEEKYCMIHLKEVMKEISQAYFEEAKWYNAGYVPTFQEYMSTALISCGYPMLSVVSLVGMGNIANKEAFDWFRNKPKLVMASSIICRLVDDIQSYEREKMSGDSPTAIDCYIKEHGVSEEVAKKKFREMVAIAWKDINKECLKPTPLDMALLMTPLNLTRVIEILYKYEDGYTNSRGETKENIKSLLVDPIPI